MKTKIKNKFTAILVAIAMLFAGFFAFGGIKTKRAKADSGTTYSGNDIEQITETFVGESLMDFYSRYGTFTGIYILIDNQISSVSTFFPALFTNLGFDGWEVEAETFNAIEAAGIHILKDNGCGDFEPAASSSNIASPGEPGFPECVFSSSTVIPMCAFGIWQLESTSYNMFSNLQQHWLSYFDTLMPIYVIEREEVIPGDSGLILMVYDDAHGGGFWGTWEGRPEE